MNIQEVINQRFNGILPVGKHEEDGVACVLEAYSVAKGVPWTDSPTSLNMPDIRPLNDARWSTPELRTKHMIRLVEACEQATPEKIERIILRTIQEILPLVLPKKRAAACAKAKTLKEARNAAFDAAPANAANAANAAAAAAFANAVASYDAANANAAADAILIAACDIWVEELTK